MDKFKFKYHINKITNYFYCNSQNYIEYTIYIYNLVKFKKMSIAKDLNVDKKKKKTLN